MVPLFHPTSWTLVLNARGRSEAARAALSDLCGAYYAPVVAFLRRGGGLPEEEAREKAHAFFAELLERGVGHPDRERGRFRSYLLGALRHFLARQRATAMAEKRGGHWQRISLESPAPGGETAPGVPSGPALPAPPDAASELLFDREWAFTLIARALASLEAEHTAKLHFFQTLKPWLDGAAAVPAGSASVLPGGSPAPADTLTPPSSQAEAAERLGLSGTAVKVAIHRLRMRFRELVRHEVAATVQDPADTAGEMRHLIAILTS